MKRIAKHAAALGLLMLASACASLPGGQETLEHRAKGYYSALIDGDFKGAYGYFAPSYRENVPVGEHYQRRPPGGRVLTAEPGKVECVSESACDVSFSTHFRFDKSVQPLGGMEVPLSFTERWVLVDGQWYLMPRR